MREGAYIFVVVNSLRQRQNGRLFADDTFKRIFLNENIIISTKNSLKFVPKGLFDNIPALVLIMAWRRPGDKPLSEPMMVSSPTHICVTRPQWVNFDALAQASDIQIERRQVVFLCWMQDSNPRSQTPIRQQKDHSVANERRYIHSYLITTALICWALTQNNLWEVVYLITLAWQLYSFCFGWYSGDT